MVLSALGNLPSGDARRRSQVLFQRGDRGCLQARQLEPERGIKERCRFVTRPDRVQAASKETVAAHSTTALPSPVKMFDDRIHCVGNLRTLCWIDNLKNTPALESSAWKRGKRVALDPSFPSHRQWEGTITFAHRIGK